MGDTLELICISCAVGIIGDTGLQMSGAMKPYFERHGRAESIFLACGMFAIFSILYFHVFNFPRTYVALFAYGLVLDAIFRSTMLFPSLKEYYETNSIFFTAVIGGSIPVMLPLFVFQVIQKLK